ncbi:hypothetical protein [Spirillospora sp. NPDC048819]
MRTRSPWPAPVWRVAGDEQLALPRILIDRRRSLGDDHTRAGRFM